MWLGWIPLTRSDINSVEMHQLERSKDSKSKESTTNRRGDLADSSARGGGRVELLTDSLSSSKGGAITPYSKSSPITTITVPYNTDKQSRPSLPLSLKFTSADSPSSERSSETLILPKPLSTPSTATRTIIVQEQTPPEPMSSDTSPELVPMRILTQEEQTADSVPPLERAQMKDDYVLAPAEESLDDSYHYVL
eukprot:TRINITY_DN32619_c0_g1_i2.p1 TRINITY_DN32619_c0_g1~~TRINITY_DN32619_c0_g1_i2.p1  ORF type:complete len:194 (-),score=1.72 TRINITY_DN32619_c0_g1_i2:84-665(-)